MSDPPVQFEEKTKLPRSDSGYPVQIPAKDLDKNFVFATVDIPEGWFETTAGQGGHRARKMLLPVPIPSAGTHVLGVVDGVLQWIATQDC
jgi:hypothetical protein